MQNFTDVTRRDLIRRGVIGLMALSLAACGAKPKRENTTRGLHTGETPELRALINQVAADNRVPASLVHRVVQRESGYNAGARNGPYYGLMQILPQTAGTMGYSGSPDGLLDARTNLTYGVRYLRGAWLVADGSEDRAVMWYSKGYYYEAKRRGMLEETGLRS